MTVSQLKHLAKMLLKPEYRRYSLALASLQNTPRYTPISTRLLGSEIQLADSASFLSMYNDILQKKIYKFRATSTRPTIIDCGANIGLSIFYFKQNYPQSTITSFEPDRKIFEILSNNISRLEFSDVKLINKAIWSSETQLEFMSEGADAGRLDSPDSDRETYQVSTVRLQDYLHQPVDFLKIDIEGAETEVLQDSQSFLSNVKNLFLEYHSFVDRPQTVHIIFQILREAGFRVHVHPSGTSPQPFDHLNTYMGMDLQLNIFAFRE